MLVGMIDSPYSLGLLLLVALLFFGPKRLPEIGRTLGSGLREFKESVTGEAQHHLEPSAAAPEPSPERDA